MKFNPISANPERAQSSVFFPHKPSTIFCVHINLACTFHSETTSLRTSSPLTKRILIPQTLAWHWALQQRNLWEHLRLHPKGEGRIIDKPACEDTGHPAVKRNSHASTSEQILKTLLKNQKCMSIFILTPPKTSHVLRNKHTNLTGMKTGDLLCSSYYREGLDLGPGIGNGDKEDLKLKKKKRKKDKCKVNGIIKWYNWK